MGGGRPPPWRLRRPNPRRGHVCPAAPGHGDRRDEGLGRGCAEHCAREDGRRDEWMKGCWMRPWWAQAWKRPAVDGVEHRPTFGVGRAPRGTTTICFFVGSDSGPILRKLAFALDVALVQECFALYLRGTERCLKPKVSLGRLYVEAKQPGGIAGYEGSCEMRARRIMRSTHRLTQMARASQRGLNWGLLFCCEEIFVSWVWGRRTSGLARSPGGGPRQGPLGRHRRLCATVRLAGI